MNEYLSDLADAGDSLEQLNEEQSEQPPITELEYKVAFEAALETFVDKCQVMIATHYATHYPNVTPEKLEIRRGKRYVKIVKGGGGVYCFVDKNGDVLKAAGWHKPAKHARGNIFNDDQGMGGVTVWGGAYLR